MASRDSGNENPALHHKVEGKEMMDYSVIESSTIQISNKLLKR